MAKKFAVQLTEYTHDPQLIERIDVALAEAGAPWKNDY